MKKNTKNRRQNYMCALVVLLTAFNVDEHFHAGLHFTVQSLAFSGHREEKARKKGHFLIKKTSLLMKMAGVFEHTAFFYSYLVVAYIQRQNLVFGGGHSKEKKVAAPWFGCSHFPIEIDFYNNGDLFFDN